MKDKILVTGAAGFIGSHLCENLISIGKKVIGLDNFDDFYDTSIKKNNLTSLKKSSNFTFYEIDITQKKEVFSVKEDFNVVIHVAGKAGVRPSVESPLKYIDTNINGTQNILDLMNQKNCKKILFASSSSVYGNNKNTPFKETHSVSNAISPYAFTKKANEVQIHTYHHLYKINAICFRFFTVYGPRQRPDLAIHKFFKKILNNETISLYGDGSTKRDYTYINDLVDGIIKGLNYLNEKKSLYEIINLGNSHPISLIEMVETIYNELRKEKNIEFLPMQMGDVDITHADITKAKKLINYNPKTTFKQGVAKFAEWYKN